MTRTRIVSLGICAMAAASIAGCGGSTDTTDVFVGDYGSTIFITTATGGQPRNEVQAGSSVTLILNSNGSTSGHLHVAASGANPVFDADMAGTWTRTGNTIALTQAADTFMRNMTFTATVGSSTVAQTLVGDQTFSGTRIQLTLALLPLL